VYYEFSQTMPQASNQVLSHYFSDYVKIPDYQREFAWDAALATQLFESFNRFLIANPQIDGPAGHGYVGPALIGPADINRFYLGTIITVDENPIPIVDGQQRLTSIAIMASILRDYCINLGEYEQAYELDRKFCWKVAMPAPANRSVYSGGTPKVVLRDTGNGNFNLLENMFNICSVKIQPEPSIVYQITNIGRAGARRNITIDKNLDWRLLEGHQLQMDSGQIVTIARTADQGLPMLQVSIADAALINIGDSFKLSYGNKIGSAPKGSTYIGKASKKLIEKITQTLDGYYAGGAGGPAAHLPDMKFYTAQWITLIENTKVTQIQFDNSGSAMEHFLVVNDKTLQKTLTDLDRLRAHIKIVFEGNYQAIPAGTVIPNPRGLGAPQLALMNDEEKLNKCITEDFETIEELLLNKREKKNSFSEDFFYDFAQVFWPLKNLQGNPREASVMPEINRQYLSDMKDGNGDYDKVEFQKFINEIRIFAGIYCRARDRWSTIRPPGPAVNYLSDVSDSDPFEPEVCERIEEFLIRVLANMGSRKQFRPTYMAGSYIIRKALENADITTDQYTLLSDKLCRSLLKMHIALQILPKATGGDDKTPGEIYAYSDNFVPTITAIPDGSPFNIIDNVFEQIKNQINNEVVSYPPEDPTGIRLPITLDNPSAKPILMLAEWQLRAAPGAILIGAVAPGAAAAVTAAMHFHDGQSNYINEVEHIQPKKTPEVWPLPPANGYTAPDEETWEENKNRLGNRLLCKRDVNNHARDKALSWKIQNGPGPVCPRVPIPPPPSRPNYSNCNGTSNHYRGDDRAIVTKWLRAEGVDGWLTPARAPPIATEPLTWGSAEIEKWEKEIVDLLLMILP
jgi:hypothetical protein